MKLRKMGMEVALLLCAAAAFAAWRVVRQVASAAPSSLTAMLPQGALLTIESPDFAGLLHEWNASPEQQAWLKSDDASVFSKSRLFGRLNDARTEFEAAARTAKTDQTSFNGDFLTQVAGKQSVFAWYDIGNLEFLYVTRISAAQAANLALAKNRAAWTARQAGGTTFYIRKTSAAVAASDPDEQGQSAQGKARTVAFAQVSDAGGQLLVLATREDLIANALVLHAAGLSAKGGADATANEAWFTKASATLPSTGVVPALHMVLNLSRLVKTPYFRSYWIQHNVTEMEQYRAAVSDLYVVPREFREERALLPAADSDSAEQADLGALAALVPADGVYRATATQNADEAVAALEEKLLGRIALEKLPAADAPDPELEAPQPGSAANDLEVRIDAVAPVSAAISNRALADAVKAAGMDAVLTYSTAQRPATAEGLWVPIHSVVALHAGSAWNPQAMQAALQQSLRGSLTTATLGIEFRAQTSGGQTIYGLTGPKPLWFAASGNVCLLSDDRAMLLSALGRVAGAATTQKGMLLAGFDHASQRAPYARLTSLIDGTNGGTNGGNNARMVEHGPAFFSGDMRSLSDAFAAMTSEKFVERRDGPVVRQTVTYEWTR